MSVQVLVGAFAFTFVGMFVAPRGPRKTFLLGLYASNKRYFAKKRCETFEESVNLTLKALRKQALKMKEK